VMTELKVPMENVRVEEKKTQIRLRRIFELRGKTRFVIISASSKWIVVVPNEGEANANYMLVCGMSSEDVIHVEGHTHPISAVNFAHQDESKFASASTDGEIRIFKANDAGVVHLLSSQHRHKSTVSQLQFHHFKDTLILSSSPNERLLIWDWMINKISFAVSSDTSIAAWSIDSRSIFTASSTQLQHRDSCTGRIHSSYEWPPNGGLPYKMLAITTCMLLVLSDVDGSSKLTLHDTGSLNCVHFLAFPDSPCLIPWYNSNLGLLTLVHTSNNSMESHQYFDCSPYLRSHLSRKAFVSSICHDWNPVDGQIGKETSLSCLVCLPSNCLQNEEDEIVSVFHAPSSSPSLFLTTIRYAPVVRAIQNDDISIPVDATSAGNDDNSSKNQVSSFPLNPPSTQLESSSIPHSGSNNQLTFSLKWNFLSQVTQADYRTKEEESSDGEDNLEETHDINQERDARDKSTIEGGSSDSREEREETERDGDSLAVQGASSTECLSLMKLDSPQSPSRSLSLQSTEISWSENDNSLVTRDSNGTTNMATVSMDDGEGESLNGKDDRDEGESRASYANVDKFVLEEAVANLELMLRKSERDRERMAKKIGEMEQDILSLRYECEFKDSRISELEGLLSVQSSAQ
ncbi:hypothetical protein PENTCL1PPCAC_22868, partial [Pristionchus entomophagus]